MPQIGWLEIFIIVSIAIIVVGPKDFPLMLKKWAHGLVQSKDMLVMFKHKSQRLQMKILIMKIKITIQ